MSKLAEAADIFPRSGIDRLLIDGVVVLHQRVGVEIRVLGDGAGFLRRHLPRRSDWWLGILRQHNTRHRCKDQEGG
jgi:hypothetical protein